MASIPRPHPRDRRDSCDTAERLIAGLWQEAPFARLPPNAPDELGDYLQDVENPCRVYKIHCATRRQGFQQLVDRFITQLRNGCGVASCPTPSCFTCRKRLAGKSPIRRYNPTSARTLAVYLASRDNPEQGLCPNLQHSRDTPVAVNSLAYSLEPRTTAHNALAAEYPDTSCQPEQKRQATSSTISPSSQTQKVSSLQLDSSANSQDGQNPNSEARSTNEQIGDPSEMAIKISERPMNKDHRSFAATLFGSVAFKMLEWLTAQGVEDMVGRINDLGPRSTSQARKETPKMISADTALHPTSGDESRHTKRSPSTRGSESGDCKPSHVETTEATTGESVSTSVDQQPMVPASDPSKPKRSSKTTLRAASTNTARRTSMEPPSPMLQSMEARPAPRTSRTNGLHSDKILRPPKSPAAVMSRGLPDIPSRPTFFENVPIPPQSTSRKPEKGQRNTEEQDASDVSSKKTHTELPSHSPSTLKEEPIVQTPSESTSLPLENYPLPQTLSQLSVELVDFISDVFQEDQSSDDTLFGNTTFQLSAPEPKRRVRRLSRKPSSMNQVVVAKHWKAFNEQVIFSVFSDSRALISSFTQDGRLYDSQSLWYCMLQLVRVMPTLVLHSLWIAAESLFVPPKALQTVLRSNMEKPTRSRVSLTASEAGYLVSICLHALMAAGSLATSSRTLYEMSRIRSSGLAFAESGSPARQPSSVCLQYDDVFTNDIALRLARRLFRAITARRCFAEMADLNNNASSEALNSDVLRPLLGQLDLLSPDSTRILEFSSDERLLHETRAPTLLLDWARAVLLNDWDGQAEFASDSPFSGALSLIAAMYEQRNVLLLGDTQFRIDYFSERLDSVDMPVAWLSHKKSRQRQHILDHPYIFNADTLVSLFRAINFSQMSRMFEESSSLKTRMNAIVDPGSLITNPHHKVILQDMLKTASSKYLILEISRTHVLRDAFDQLWRRERRELLRPLKVHLGEGAGEEGFDSGGVQQEFFRLIIAECLDPKYGAFTVDERTRMAWFAPSSIVESWKFELVGLLISLAVYNGLTLPVTFPRALYRKLLGQPVCELHHIADGWPDLASGLTTLVEWDERDGQVEDVFARTYEFSVSALGKNINSQMSRGDEDTWPQNILDSQGNSPPDLDEAPLVTSENRDDYVSDYVRYLTDVSVRRQFLAFEQGFRSCLEARSLSLLSPSILQSVIEGVQEIDVADLRRYARYVGWDASHHTIKDFWSIVKRYDDDMKRKLLEFVTASDRVPVGGLRNLQFVIQRNGEEEGEGGHLPTAYTCYGTLLLPEYRDKEVLRERLGMALENAQGFGFA
ncbi:Ubiquitin-protein ligase E3A [Paramyrothecium foliicola]|nr:Ubiquitin-protein ligase E3A [Paramyrothecium foliicola]